MAVTAEVSFVPADIGSSLGKYVRGAVEVLKSTECEVEVHPMNSVVRAKDLTTLFAAIEKVVASIHESGEVKTVQFTLRAENKV